MASDRILGLVVTFAALAYIASATQIQVSFMSDPMGSKVFPILIGIVAAICGVFLIVKPDPEPDWPAARTFLSLGFTVVVLVAYAYLLKPLGFLIPTAIAAGIISFQISPRPVPAVLSGLSLSIGLFIIFKFALGLSLQGVPKAWMG